jgi:Tol biopolymer transport system component
MAQAFNVRTFTLENEPVPISEGVEASGLPGFPSFSVSDTGVLVYGTGGGTVSALQLVWVDRQGKAVGTVGPPANYRGIDISPDGGRVAAYRFDGQGGDTWITDVARGTASRFTFDASQLNSSPVWSPDGTQIVYASLRAGKWGIYRKASNGASDEERLFESDVQALPDSWSSDGRFIVFDSGDSRASANLSALPLTGDRKPVPIVHSAFQASHGQVSPDAKWIAYESNETGRMEIYVRPFPSGAGKWQLSTNGGSWPRWQRDGRQVFYMAPGGVGGTALLYGKLVSVAVSVKESTFQFGVPHELTETGYINLPSSGRYQTFAVSPDGQRFLIPRPQSTAVAQTSPPIVVVLNWASGLTK